MKGITVNDIVRSKTMRAVKSEGNKSTELLFIKNLKLASINGWRRKYKLPGRPDITFPKSRVVVFLDGCFWHGHFCKSIPKTNNSYWSNKINRNVARDAAVSRQLKKEGWRVIRIWECKMRNMLPILKKLKKALEN